MTNRPPFILVAAYVRSAKLPPALHAFLQKVQKYVDKVARILYANQKNGNKVAVLMQPFLPFYRTDPHIRCDAARDSGRRLMAIN